MRQMTCEQSTGFAPRQSAVDHEEDDQIAEEDYGYRRDTYPKGRTCECRLEPDGLGRKNDADRHESEPYKTNEHGRLEHRTRGLPSVVENKNGTVSEGSETNEPDYDGHKREGGRGQIVRHRSILPEGSPALVFVNRNELLVSRNFTFRSIGGLEGTHTAVVSGCPIRNSVSREPSVRGLAAVDHHCVGASTSIRSCLMGG
jgi:hypothetical protein